MFAYGTMERAGEQMAVVKSNWPGNGLEELENIRSLTYAADIRIGIQTRYLKTFLRVLD
jgi:hypothetical protein